MQPNLKVIISVEKRINFSLSELTVQAVQYDIFKSRFCVVRDDKNAAGTMTSDTCQIASREDCVNKHCHACSEFRFIGKQILNSNIPQRFIYDRSSQLELWEIKLK